MANQRSQVFKSFKSGGRIALFCESRRTYFMGVRGERIPELKGFSIIHRPWDDYIVPNKPIDDAGQFFAALQAAGLPFPLATQSLLPS